MLFKGTPQPASPPLGSASAMAMLHDDRVLFVYRDGTVYRPVETVPAARQVPLTVVIPIHEIGFLDEVLRSLILQKYDKWQILLVCSDPAIQHFVFESAASYQLNLPKIEVFVLQEKGWLSDALNAALHHVSTAYWCRLDSDDLLHPMALQVVSARIQQYEPDYLYSARFIMDRVLYVYPVVVGDVIDSPHLVWSGTTFPYSHLMTYKTEAVASIGGFKSFDQFPNDAGWIAAYEMLIAGKRFHYINGALYYWRKWQSASRKEKTASADYRRGLILGHWPDRYVEDYSSR